MSKIVKSLAFVVMVTLIGITAASAYVLLSPPRRWFSPPRNVTVDSRGLASVNDGSRGVNAAVNAVGAWGTQIVKGTAGTVSYVLGDDPRHICKGSYITATTTGYYDTNTAGTCGGLNVVSITDSDVAFNLAFNYTTTGETDGKPANSFCCGNGVHEAAETTAICDGNF